jgi:hypothetical protein
MKNQNVLFLVGCFLAIFALLNCGRQEASLNPSDYPASLIVAEKAVDVAYDQSRGALRVHYVLETPYPAAGFLAEIESRLSNLGWRPLKADFLNPDTPTAHVTGWRKQTNPATRPPTVVHEWNGEWENAAQDVLVYALAYRYPEGDPPNLSHMSVFAIHIPRAAADKARAHVDKF